MNECSVLKRVHFNAEKTDASRKKLWYLRCDGGVCCLSWIYIFIKKNTHTHTLIFLNTSAPLFSQIFNLARRIVIGEYQNIVLNEFLPILIGTNSVATIKNGKTTYNPNIDPSISNEFSAAVFRFNIHV